MPFERPCIAPQGFEMIKAELDILQPLSYGRSIKTFLGVVENHDSGLAPLEKEMFVSELDAEPPSQVRARTRKMCVVRIPVSPGLSLLSIEASCYKAWNVLSELIKSEDNRD